MTATDQALAAPVRPAPPRRPGVPFWRRANVPGGILGLAWLVVVVVPIYWVLLSSLTAPQDTFASTNPLAPPRDPTLDNYALAMESGLARYFVNSLVVVVGAVALAVFACLLAAYVITRSRSRFARSSFSFFLLGLAIPSQAAIIPIFYLINKMRLYDTLTAVILPSAAFTVPITTVILVNFLRDIPGELFESMRMDGASNWRVLWALVLPLSRPALITVAIYDGMTVWNGFLFPLVLTEDPAVRTIPLGLWSFSYDLTLNVPAMMAAVTLSVLPIVTLYALGRRQLLAGLTAGFGK